MKRLTLIAIVLSLSCMAYASGWDIYMDTTSTPFQTYIANHPGVSGAIAPTRIHTSAGSDTLANATITGSVHTPRITTTGAAGTRDSLHGAVTDSLKATAAITTPKIISSGTQTAGTISFSSVVRKAVYIAGLNANCIPSAANPDSLTAIAISAAMYTQSGDVVFSLKCKTDSLILNIIDNANALISGTVSYHIIWFP